MLLGNLQHLMDWIIGFLETHDRLHTFDNIWSSLPLYSGNYVPRKSYRLLSQLSGKEMRGLLIVILGVFTTALYHKTDTPRPTASQEQEFKKAITCVRYLIHFALLSKYRSYTESTIEYIREYLQKFYETKNIFLRYQAGKASKAKADMVSKELTAQNNARNIETNLNRRTAAQKARATAEDREERAYLVNQALVEDSHFNFPKVHLMMHWANQISHYGSLPQYSIEIYETSHKALKDAYRRSNHMDSIPQILKGYSRGYSFAVKELEMSAWSAEEPAIAERVKDVLRPKRKQGQLSMPEGTRMYMTLQEVYNILEIPVPDQDADENNNYKLQYLHATGRRNWRKGGPRRDAVWGSNRELYKLAYLTLLDWLGNPTPHGPEGMSSVQVFLSRGRETIVWLQAVEGAVNLI
ncbi:hypothetical protein EV426DRAFT_578816 [Tirmania nivea]|nr:hypothetical protein EV426DRAFT_578816 [Tirmania nivea]